MIAALSWVKYGAAKAVPVKETVDEEELEEEEDQMNEENAVDDEEEDVDPIDRARVVSHQVERFCDTDISCAPGGL